MSLIQYLVLFSCVFVAGACFYIFKKANPNYLKLSLAFTGGYLFAISMVHLIPGVYSQGSANIGYFILGGFFLQLVLEFFSEGIEHGHIHVHSHHGSTFPFAMMAGLCIHSFLEGMPLSGYYTAGDHQDSLLAGILLHHLPVAFALVSMLSASGFSMTISLINLGIFALMAPAGAAFSTVLGHNDVLNSSAFINPVMAVVIGIFLHISTTILFESSSDHRFNLYKLTVIVAGALLAVFS